MKIPLKWAAGCLAGGFILLQLVRPSIPTKAATAEIQAPPNIRQILSKNCYPCHSDERRLAWFDEVVPAYWLVRHDVLTARQHLNFSTLGAKPSAAQRGTLFEAVNMIQLGAMPLSDFTRLHPEARVRPEELAELKTYLAPWATAPKPASSRSEAPMPMRAAVRDEFNGLPFDGSFENWKPISTTDRGDNNTFRFILGNDVAIEAARSGHMSPWPDGSRLAKVAWEKETGTDGLVHTGKFVQVELMVKDAHRYRDTDGWGWGRWRGLDLKPYGKNASFVGECTGCHLPVRGNDYVYTLPITAAYLEQREIVNNRAAVLPSNLPYQPLGWNAITLYVDPKNGTTSTLYGNEAARKTSRTGAVLALVTWAQREDPHWFGARIPDVPRSVEFVETGVDGHAYRYRNYSGTGLQEQHPGEAVETQRAAFVLSLKPAELP